MSKTVNRVTILGNILRAPTLNKTTSGATVCNAAIATNNRITNKPQFTDIVLWNRAAEAFHKQVVEGTRVYIEGYINTYSNKDDNQKTEVVVSDFAVLDGGGVKPEEVILND